MTFRAEFDPDLQTVQVVIEAEGARHSTSLSVVEALKAARAMIRAAEEAAQFHRRVRRGIADGRTGVNVKTAVR